MTANRIAAQFDFEVEEAMTSVEMADLASEIMRSLSDKGIRTVKIEIQQNTTDGRFVTANLYFS